MVHAEKERKPLDSLQAKTAFALSLGFWIPLFNIGLCITSLILAFNAWKKIQNEPSKYGGFWLVVAAMVLSFMSLILTAVGGFIYVASRNFSFAP